MDDYYYDEISIDSESDEEPFEEVEDYDAAISILTTVVNSKSMIGETVTASAYLPLGRIYRIKGDFWFLN